MICFCGRPAVRTYPGLCAVHLLLACRVRRARVSDAARRLVIHQRLPAVVVRCPAPATVNALLTWDAADRARRGVAA